MTQTNCWFTNNFFSHGELRRVSRFSVNNSNSILFLTKLPSANTLKIATRYTDYFSDTFITVHRLDIFNPHSLIWCKLHSLKFLFLCAIEKNTGNSGLKQQHGNWILFWVNCFFKHHFAVFTLPSSQGSKSKHSDFCSCFMLTCLSPFYPHKHGHNCCCYSLMSDEHSGHLRCTNSTVLIQTVY